MNHPHIFKRILCLMLVLAMTVGNVLPGMAITINEDGEQLVTFTRVDNSAVSSGLTPSGQKELTEENQYADSDVVRVSIILDKKSTIEAGFSTMDIAFNKNAMNYRESLKNEQTNMVHKIESTIQSELDVVWNLTLAANIISANVKYGQIKAIEAMSGVKSVFIENQYLPNQAQTGSVRPNMATSGAQIGSGLAWNAGYTGAGTRIAVIDTGTDTNHQSLNSDAFEYSLSLLAEKAGMTYEAYVESLDLLDAEKIAKVMGELHVDIDPETAYFGSKLPFGYNYKDAD